jgi:hypothetical protein
MKLGYLFENILNDQSLVDQLLGFNPEQDILDQMMIEGSIPQLSSEWTGTKMTPDRMIWTAKGSRKHENEQYVNLLNFYNSQV